MAVPVFMGLVWLIEYKMHILPIVFDFHQQEMIVRDQYVHHNKAQSIKESNVRAKKADEKNKANKDEGQGQQKENNNDFDDKDNNTSIDTDADSPYPKCRKS